MFFQLPTVSRGECPHCGLLQANLTLVTLQLKTSIEDVESESFQSRNSTKAEIYIQSMLKSSGHHGLACWSPKPREPLVNGKGVIPGDVGTFSAGYGFRKFFNIWEGELGERLMAAGSRHQFPSGGVIIHPTELEEGQAIFHGTSSSVHRTPDGRWVALIFVSSRRLFTHQYVLKYLVLRISLLQRARRSFGVYLRRRPRTAYRSGCTARLYNPSCRAHLSTRG
jgi:hypothetical protein